MEMLMVSSWIRLWSLQLTMGGKKNTDNYWIYTRSLSEINIWFTKQQLIMLPPTMQFASKEV